MKTMLPVLMCASLALADARATAEERTTDQAQVPLAIKRQSLRDALNDWAHQTGFQIISEIPATYVSPGIEGTLTPTAALERLLSGTPFVYEWLGDRAVAVRWREESETSRQLDRGHRAKSRVAQYRGATEASTHPMTHASADTIEPKPSSGQVKIETIIVTAQKREERLIDVPQSVTVLSSESLQQLGATQFRDFANTIPGLNYNTTGAGFTQIALRGVTTGYDVGQTVAIYVDEVPYGSSTNVTGSARRALDVGLFDIDRIEVLKGPQGTLYGASAMGGLIKYVTRKPSSTQYSAELQTGVSSTHEGGLNYNGAGSLNIPISVDKAAARLTAFYSHDDGYVDNLALNREDVDRSRISGGRADFLITPHDSLSIRLTGFAQDIDRDGQGTADFSFATRRPFDDELSQRRLVPEPFAQQYRLVNATINYDFGPASVTSVSSFQTVESIVHYDLSIVYLPILARTGRNYSATAFKDDLSTDKFVQELRLEGLGKGRFDWVLGGFYTKEESDFDQAIHALNLSRQPVNENILGNSTPSAYEEYAAFGNLTWRLSDKFDVSGGLRFAQNREETMRIGSGILGTSRPKRSTENNVRTYLANARYHFSHNATGYLRYATGYRPGGVNFVLNDPLTGAPIAQPTYDADTLRSYEIGFKGQTTQRSVEIDASVFYIDWRNIQITAVRNGAGTRINAPDGATIKGFESGLTVRPTDSFTISGAFAYQDAAMNEANADIRAARGERLPNVPRLTGTISADYVFLDAAILPSVGATMRYVSDRRANFNAATAPPQYPLPSYVTVDLRAGFAVGPVSTQFFVRNLLDERSELAMFNWNSTYAQAAVLQPRTFGVTATTRF